MNQASGLGVVTLDRDLVIQSWNQWIAAASGVTEEGARGQSFLSVVPDARIDSIRSLLHDVLSTGTSRVLAPAFHRFVIACAPLEPSRHFTEMQQFVTIAPLRSGGVIDGAIITIEDAT